MDMMCIQEGYGKYTWYKENGLAKSRIDRVMVSLEWLDQWPNSK